MVAFDIEAIVTEFMAAPDRTSLELPHMTTGQRKSTKKVLDEKFTELRCESFGFGKERQLHLFKNGTEAKRMEDTCFKFGISSPDRSTIASSDETSSTKGSPVGGSPLTSEREIPMPVKREELPVRNTFIHIGEPGSPCDARAVQSMPHGMFRQCILTEMSQKVVAHTGPLACPEPEGEPAAYEYYDSDSDYDEHEATQRSPIDIGSLVVVEGLVKLPAFNGQSAVVEGFDEATQRYSILLASSVGSQQAKVKAENLRMVLPCP